MASILKPKRRTTDGTAPTTANLADGEVAINHVTKTIYQRIGAAVVAVANFFTDAPSDGKTYGRKDADWAEITAGGGGGSGPPTFTAKDVNYTFVAGDAGGAYALTLTTSRTWTIPASTFSAGDYIWVANQTTNLAVVINIARASGMNLYIAGATTDGTKVVAIGGMGLLYFLSATRVVFYGSGIG